jgi:hypothetical protein
MTERETLEQAAKVADKWEAQYPVDVFPADGASIECRAAHHGRHVAKCIAEDIRSLLSPPPRPEPTHCQVFQAGLDGKKWRCGARLPCPHHGRPSPEPTPGEPTLPEEIKRAINDYGAAKWWCGSGHQEEAALVDAILAALRERSRTNG